MLPRTIFNETLYKKDVKLICLSACECFCYFVFMLYLSNSTYQVMFVYLYLRNFHVFITFFDPIVDMYTVCTPTSLFSCTYLCLPF